jgi:PAS domain S-box-containing protein
MLDSNIVRRLIREIGKLGFLKASLHQVLVWPAVCLILGALIWYAVLAKIDADKIEYRTDALNEASSLAHAYAQYVAHAIEQVNEITLRVKFDWERSHGKLDLAKLSDSGIFRNSQIIYVAVVNRKGMPITQTRFDGLQFRPVPLADRGYFRYHRSDKTNVLLIGNPIVGRMTEKRVVQFTRRLEAADGSFSGVVVVSVTPDYFTSFYAGSNPGKTGLLAVVGNDGSLRSARVGDALQEPGAPAFRAIPLFDTPQGTTFLDGKQWFADERARFIAWETLKAYPLVAMAGIAEEELLAPHRKTSALYRQQAVAASVVLFLLALAGMGWSARLAWKKHYSEEVRKAYRIATEGGNEGFYMLHALRDKNGVIVDFEVVDCNERGAVFYGLEKSQLLGLKFSTRFFKSYFDVLMDAFNKAMKSGFYEGEMEIPQDSRLKMDWASIRLVRAGTGLAVTVRDISERKQAEAGQRLAASVFDNTLDGIFITDENFKIIAVNRAFTDITGYSATEAMGNTPRLLRSCHHDEAFYEAMRRAISETGSWQGEIWDERKNGEPFCELLAIGAVRGEGGEITNYCAIFADITERKVAEAELMRLNAELEARVAQRTAALDHANKELEAFSYSVSHDLRAPLRHISGFIAIVLKANEGKLDAASVDYLNRINAASARMGLLIADLLELSRISRQKLNKRDFNFSELAGQVVDSLIQAHPEREVRVTVKPEMKANGDPGLVRIVLGNLLGNAWKFTSRTNEPAIEVGLEERGGETMYYVRDNGAGFDMKYAHKLFEPFQRLHTDNEFKGTGIGLSIVQRIVVRHGGRIWAEAKAGEGAAFYFNLGKS